MTTVIACRGGECFGLPCLWPWHVLDSDRWDLILALVLFGEGGHCRCMMICFSVFGFVWRSPCFPHLVACCPYNSADEYAGFALGWRVGQARRTRTRAWRPGPTHPTAPASRRLLSSCAPTTLRPSTPSGQPMVRSTPSPLIAHSSTDAP